MTSLGLAAFVGLTGIHAGPIFVSALREAGLGLLIGGMVVTLAATVRRPGVRPFRLADEADPSPRGFDRGQTVTAAMAALQERSGSPVPVLGYTPAYPIANILLTTWGTITVVVMAG